MVRPRRDGPSPARPETDRDRSSEEPGWSDFLTVENQRRELFPQEFPDGAYGAPPIDGDAAEDPGEAGDKGKRAPGS